MDSVGNDVDTLYEEIEHLMGHLVGNDVDTLHEEIGHLVGYIVGNNVDTLHKKKSLVGFSFIRVYISGSLPSPYAVEVCASRHVTKFNNKTNWDT
jgi:hypothetical protein